MEDQEQNDPVWELLEHAGETKPGPFFSRNVVREVRLVDDSAGGFGSNLFSFFGKRMLATGIAAAVVIGAIAFFPAPSATSPSTEMAQTPSVEETGFDPASELDEVEYLGQLVAVTDPGKLTDDALADLFF